MCVGKIALFDKALVLALASGALAMCAMWVGFLSSFLRVGRKKQNKFPSNLHCPVIKLNSFVIIYHYRICLSAVFLHLLPTDGGMFLLPISKHCTVKLHETLLDAETLKLVLTRQ